MWRERKSGLKEKRLFLSPFLFKQLSTEYGKTFPVELPLQVLASH